MDLLLELLMELLLLLLYVPYHVHTRVPSCNAGKKMKLPEKSTRKEPFDGSFENPFLMETIG